MEVVSLNWSSLYVLVDHISTSASIPLALMGFGFTLWQLKKTRSAAESAKKSANDAVNRVRRLNLMALLPHLQRIEDEIDRAIRADSIDLVLAWLSMWRWHAGELRGYLSAQVTMEKKLMKAIQTSIVICGAVKSEIYQLDGTKISPVAAKLQESIGAVTAELGSLSAGQILRLEDGIDG